MSFLSDEIERQLTQSGQSVDDVVRKTGLTRSQVYLWRRGEQTSINEPQLTALALSLSDNPFDHASMVCAHLLDERFGPGSELVRVEVDSSDTLKDRPRPKTKGEKAIQWLSEERLNHRELNDMLISMCEVMGADLNSSKVDAVGSAVIGAAAVAATKPQSAAIPVTKYPPHRRSKKKPTA